MLYLLPHLYLANEILNRFSVRIHSRIVEKGNSWARLWYLLRGLDSQGSGYLRLPLVTISHLLGAASSSIYQWLREGKAAGAIRWWKCQRGNLRIALGSLFKVCRSLGLDPDLSDLELSSRRKFNKAKGLLASYREKTGFAPWGVTASIPLFHLSSLQIFRAAATAATTQRLQQLSRFAAWKNLPPQKRKKIRLPQPERFFPSGKQQSGFSDDSASGNLPPCCIHIGRKRAWVSRGFVPFGTSQEAIARERSLCTRTVRRHLNLLQIERRQLVQSKGDYKIVADCLAHDAGSTKPSDHTWLHSNAAGEYFLLEWQQDTETEGRYNKVKVGEVGFHRIQSRFFQYGKNGKTWLYRTNLYKPSVTLCSMSAARTNYRRVCKTESVLQSVWQKTGEAVCSMQGERSSFSFGEKGNFNALHAEKDGHFS